MVGEEAAAAAGAGQGRWQAPLLTADLAGTGGRIRERLEDFVVDEVPAYLPCGEGEHLMVRVEKRGLTTDEAARVLAGRAGVSPAAVGFAGRKDRHAVTTQWMTLQGAEAARLEGFETEGLRVLEVGRHRNKLKAGHLAANRFELTLRGVGPEAASRAGAVLERIRRRGLPNGFGPQRFGAGGRNPERALEWIAGPARPPRDRRKRQLLVSALQAALFNAVLARRMVEGTYCRPLAGDVLKLHGTGGMFVSAGEAEDGERAERGEVSPTGPIYGARMWWPEAQALALEEAVLAGAGLGREHLERFRSDGKGSRRPLRVFPRDLALRPAGEDALVLAFELDPGAFATTLVAEVTKTSVAEDVRARGPEPECPGISDSVGDARDARGRLPEGDR